VSLGSTTSKNSSPVLSAFTYTLHFFFRVVDPENVLFPGLVISPDPD
jgi:hypothetical protein